MAPMTFTFEVKVSVPEGDKSVPIAPIVKARPSVFDRLGRPNEGIVAVDPVKPVVHVRDYRSRYLPKKKKGKGNSSHVWKRPMVVPAKVPLDKGKGKAVDEAPSRPSVFSRLGGLENAPPPSKKTKGRPQKQWVPKPKKD